MARSTSREAHDSKLAKMRQKPQPLGWPPINHAHFPMIASQEAAWTRGGTEIPTMITVSKKANIFRVIEIPGERFGDIFDDVITDPPGRKESG
jgi:hypothetical protein